jgi:hypothetical protein
VAHVEARLRRRNWAAPEEINRVIADRISALLFCPSEEAVENLRQSFPCRAVASHCRSAPGGDGMDSAQGIWW